MTKREKMATALEAVSVDIDPRWLKGTVDPKHDADCDAIDAAAAELRKRCDGCKHWYAVKINPVNSHVERMACIHPNRVVTDKMPADGSGFCHLHTEPKS